ncbi:MAG TPA: glycosyltransferase family 4 protein [Polyangiaceae bacterium]|nr:glycosyltransferase family 4 protein [Polyangiaceae bacterium]
MRVAWLTPYLPFPENTGGRIRIARLAHGLRGRAELTLFSCLSQHDAPDTVPRGAFEPWSHVHTVGRVESLPLLRFKPDPALRMPSELGRALAAADAQSPFDAVVVEHCYAIEALPALRRAVVVLAEHNIESDYYRRAASRAPHKLLEYWSWRRYERAAWRRADQVVTVSERDAQVVQTELPGKGVDVSNGTRFDAFNFVKPSERQGSAILYVGMMDYGPNIEAARQLALEVLPLVRESVPEATLTLCGRGAGKAVRALGSDSVRVTGTLPEVFSLFDRHAAYAMPLQHGAGSSLKALEPLAAGLPLVASSFGVRGYHLDDSEYLPAEDVQSFARALVSVLTRRAELDAMAERGRKAAQRYSWQGLGARFADIVERAVAAHGARRAS